MSAERQLKIAHQTVRPTGPRARTSGRRPIGQLLVDDGRLSSADLLRALAIQNRVAARFGDILLAHGLVDRETLYSSIAQQFDTEVADFTTTPPDIRLVDRFGLPRCLNDGFLPWQYRSGWVLVATARPEKFAGLKPELEAIFGPVSMVVASEQDIHSAVLNRNPRQLALRAEVRVPQHVSCRAWGKTDLALLTAPLFVSLSLLAVSPRVAMTALLIWAMFALIGCTAMKLAAWVATLSTASRTRARSEAKPHVRFPTISLLVPLYQERRVAMQLVERLNRLDYPRELLDICLVVEADDHVTSATLGQMRLPDHIRQIVVPEGSVKTKPRALNFALDFCRGAIIGVYGAEDAPEPDQLHKVVAHFAGAAPDVACLQGILAFYNSTTNWLARCFALEYAAWFRVILPGLAKLGLVVPLGGTTLFFRRDALQSLEGWDAHNVTEDADLGLRLSRAGYRTELVKTVTFEEANCRVLPWIKQRSRWLKGYAITWAVHMRNPLRLWSDLGAWRFLGVQMLFLGTILTFLSAPLLWSFWIIPLGFSHPMADTLSATLMFTLIGLFIGSEIVNLAVAATGAVRAKLKGLIPWVPVMHLYFPLAAAAMYRGFAELFWKPFYWAKTSHGHFAEEAGTIGHDKLQRE